MLPFCGEPQTCGLQIHLREQNHMLTACGNIRDRGYLILWFVFGVTAIVGRQKNGE